MFCFVWDGHINSELEIPFFHDDLELLISPLNILFDFFFFFMANVLQYSLKLFTGIFSSFVIDNRSGEALQILMFFCLGEYRSFCHWYDVC